MIDIFGVNHPECIDCYSRSEKVFCAATGSFSDATAPGLTATSALTTWTAYLIDLWVTNWSGLYFCGVKFTGFRSQLGVLLPNICQLIPSAVLLTKNKQLANKDYLLLSTIEHQPDTTTTETINLTFWKNESFSRHQGQTKIRWWRYSQLQFLIVYRCRIIHPTWNRCFLNAFKKRLTMAISTQIDNNNVVALHYFINMNYQLPGI